jgi:hypothetical protein
MSGSLYKKFGCFVVFILVIVRRFGTNKGTWLRSSHPSVDLPRAFSMAEPSIAEAVTPLASEDKAVEDFASTPQQHENPSDPPLADEINTGNGTVHEVSANENGAAVEGAVATEDTQTKPAVAADPDPKAKADKPEDMPKKTPASSASRSVKPSNPTKSGAAPVAKSGGLGASVRKV